MIKTIEKELAHLVLLDMEYVESCAHILLEFSDKDVVRKMLEINNIVELKIFSN